MPRPKVWVEINKKNLISNILQFKKHIGQNVKLATVVKSNAYGHGIDLVSLTAQENGSDFLVVDSLIEAKQLRKLNIFLPILVIGYIDPEDFLEAIENNISFVLCNQEFIDLISVSAKKANKKAKVHIKAETGTNRQGIELNVFGQILDQIISSGNIEIEGIYTHYANIEDTTDQSYAKRQLSAFKDFIQIAEEKNINIPIKHTASTAGAINFPDTYFNMCRVGIGTYGLWPSQETKVTSLTRNIELNLQPIMTWKTKICQIKNIKANSAVSYGCTEKVTHDSKICVLPVGYWDGYDRKLSSIGNVLISGKRAKILGRICMNMMMADISHIENCKIGDEVVLLGKQGDEEIPAEEIARKIGTINYEVVTRINPMILRVLV